MRARKKEEKYDEVGEDVWGRNVWNHKKILWELELKTVKNSRIKGRREKKNGKRKWNC